MADSLRPITQTPMNIRCIRFVHPPTTSFFSTFNDWHTSMFSHRQETLGAMQQSTLAISEPGTYQLNSLCLNHQVFRNPLGFFLHVTNTDTHSGAGIISHLKPFILQYIFSTVYCASPVSSTEAHSEQL